MVEKLYSKDTLQNTVYYKRFKQALTELDTLEDHQFTHSEAQKQLRGDNTVMVIPRSKYDEIIPLFEQLEKEDESKKRTIIRRKIETYTCSIRKYSYKDYLSPIDHYRKTTHGK